METRKFEGPTILVVCICYVCWIVSTVWLAAVSLPLAIGLLALVVTLHSSLQHEVIHGHPFKSQRLSDAIVFPAVGLFIPYERFRDTHLAHHRDALLTDPYDDPETQYLDPKVWETLPALAKGLLRLNGSLIGRMILGPFISQFSFMRADWLLIRAGSHRVKRSWMLHLLGVVPILLWLGFVAEMPVWAYILACYLGLSILRIRIFLEHRAHEHAAGRTVIVEDRGPLSFLFLNNNFHAVHHMKPGTPWYELPKLYFENRDIFLERNLGYSYPSYRTVIAQYLFRTKEPVAHPHYK